MESLPPLKIDVTNITLIDGDQYTVTANRKDLTYKSNNSNVAVVSPKGVITAVGTGTATISVIDSESNVVQIKVTVKPITTNTTTTTTTTTITTTTTTLPIKPYDYMLGDVNNDGLINAVDASSVLAYYARISTNQEG